MARARSRCSGCGSALRDEVAFAITAARSLHSGWGLGTCKGGVSRARGSQGAWAVEGAGGQVPSLPFQGHPALHLGCDHLSKQRPRDPLTDMRGHFPAPKAPSLVALGSPWWETQMDFLAPGFGPALSPCCRHLGSELNEKHCFKSCECVCHLQKLPCAPRMPTLICILPPDIGLVLMSQTHTL